MKNPQTILERFNRLLNGEIRFKVESGYHVPFFDDLVDAGLIGCTLTGFGQYYYPLDGFQSTPRTIVFRLPNELSQVLSIKKINGKAEISERPKATLKLILNNYLLFFNDWILKGEEVGKAEDLPTESKAHLLALIYHYMRTEGVISIPQFMLEGFMRELKGLNLFFVEDSLSQHMDHFKPLEIRFDILDNDPKLVCCPRCRNQIILRRAEKIIKCECGCKFPI